MKVQNTTIFMGGNTGRERTDGTAEGRKNQKNIFAGSLSKSFDPIAKKKQDARKQAMKIIGDAWASDREIEDDLKERRNKIKEYQDIIGQANRELRRINDDRLALRDAYGVAEDSQEEQDLRLLDKELDADRIGSGVHLTAEEKERLAQIKEKGLTEYQTRSLEMKKSGSVYEDELEEAEKGVREENYAIREIKRELPKVQTMIKARKSADEVLEAASDEIVGMLTEEAKDHIDEEMEEKKEAAEKKAEEEKELEEKIEKRKEDKEEQEEFAEQIAASTELMAEADSTMDEVQKEIRKIIDEMKLIEEDIKGAAVDTVG